jgi:hypothetical protein
MADSGPTLVIVSADVRSRNQRKLPVKRMELKPDLAFVPRARYVTG